MADTRHPGGSAPVEGDGIHYGGIVWFAIVLAGTVVFCQLVVWGLFRFSETYRVSRPEITRAPLAAPPGTPGIKDGRFDTGAEPSEAPSPGLIIDEHQVLEQFRQQEEQTLHTYGWEDEASGTVRLTIDRAKELLLERGLPTRPPMNDAAPAAATTGGASQ